MIEGKLAGLFAAASLGYDHDLESLAVTYRKELEELRSGEAGS